MQKRTLNKNMNIKYEDLGDRVEVASVDDKIHEARLRQFRHVKRRCKMPQCIGVKGWSWIEVEVIRRKMAQLQLTEDIILDRRLWRTQIKVKVSRQLRVVLLILPYQQFQYFSVVVFGFFDLCYYLIFLVLQLLYYFVVVIVFFSECFVMPCLVFCLGFFAPISF